MAAEENVKQLKAKNQELQHEISELGRQHELRGRELNAERKRAARIDEVEAELEDAREDTAETKRVVNDQRVELEHLRAEVEKAEQLKADLEALKRLIS